MEKGRQETAKFHRPRVTSTPERKRHNSTSIRAGNSRQTVSAHEISNIRGKVDRKKSPVGRQSMMPSSTIQEDQKKLDPNAVDIELNVLYNEYLCEIMKDLIMRKTVEQKKRDIIAQLATVAKESEEEQQKLFKLKCRETNVKYLTIIQNELDVQNEEINKFIEQDGNHTVQEILVHLHSLLKPLDALCCKNIVLPSTPKEMEEMQEAVHNCSNTLTRIEELIGAKVEMYKAVNSDLQEFNATYTDVEALQKKLDTALYNLQALTLKTASMSLHLNT